jgi:RNA polymerase sigma-70 factor (ECF subfamily)
MNLSLEMAEDLGQTGLLKYLQISEDQRRRIRSPRAYLYRIIRNELLNQIRKEDPRAIISLESVETNEMGFQFAEDASSVEIGLMLKEVWTALEGDDRRLLELLTFGYNGREMALRLGVTEDTARQRVSRLKAKLKAILVGRTNPRYSHE